MNQTNQLQPNSTCLNEPCLKSQDLIRWTPAQGTPPWSRKILEQAALDWSEAAKPASDEGYAIQCGRLMTHIAEAYENQVKDPSQIEANWRECLRDLPFDLLEKAVTYIIREWLSMKKPTGAQIRSHVTIEASDRKIAHDQARMALKRLPERDDRPKVSDGELDKHLATLRANFPSMRK